MSRFSREWGNGETTDECLANGVGGAGRQVGGGAESADWPKRERGRSLSPIRDNAVCLSTEICLADRSSEDLLPPQNSMVRCRFFESAAGSARIMAN